MDEKHIKLVAEVMAIRILLIEMMTALDRANGLSAQDAAQRRETTVALVRMTTVPGVGSAMSDHVSAEIQEALEAILTRVEANLRLPPA